MEAVSTIASTDQVAHICKAAGDPLRVDILRALATDSYGVLELCHAFQVKQSGMSHHLKVLANAGLVNSRREGNSIFYRRAQVSAQDPCRGIKQGLFHSLSAQGLNTDVQARLSQVHSERARASRQFFVENADKFREQQDLIASFPVYGQQVADLLHQTALPGRQRALEVGPGEGEFLCELADNFEQVLALDTSAVMLARAEQLCAGKTNVSFVNADTGYLATVNDRFDCAVINMVLHHTPSPRQVFSDVSARLTAGGVILVTDLCRHDQSWASEACGDVWLGFEPADFSQWAAEAGLCDGESIYFALRNGFQIQIRQFIKRHA